MKKHKGNIVEEVMFGGIIILGIMILVLAVLYIVKLANFKTEVEGYARSAMLRMETEGYLTPAEAVTLKQELANCGVKNIDLTDTTISQVGYGQAIYLHIRYDIPVEQLEMSGGILSEILFRNVLVPDEIRLKSTAKH